MVDSLLDIFPRLVVDPVHNQLLATNNDAVDALVACLTARAAALDLTDRPAPHHREVAAREGWIALPQTVSLDQLPEPPESLPILRPSPPFSDGVAVHAPRARAHLSSSNVPARNA